MQYQKIMMAMKYRVPHWSVFEEDDHEDNL